LNQACEIVGGSDLRIIYRINAQQFSLFIIAIPFQIIRNADT
jgi:hypothetical protein